MVRIPGEYQEVEYLESVGGQYINLPYGFADTDEVEITASELSGYTDKFMIAPSQWNDNTNRFSMVGQYSGAFAVGFGNMGTSTGRFTPSQQSDKLVHTWTYQNRTFAITDLGATKSVSSTAFNAETKYLRLFYGYNASSRGRIYSYKHKKANGDEYIFIPCYRKSDNEPGMYDLVSGTFYTNAGTGTFLVGNDVEYSTVSLLEARRKILLNTPHLENISGTLATFKTDLAAPIKDMKVHFYPVQAEGTPRPDNVLPISGWDEVSVTRCGKNRLDPDGYTPGYYIDTDGSIKTTTVGGYSALVPVPPDTTVTFSGKSGESSANNKRLHAYDSDGNWIKQMTYGNVTNHGSYTRTAVTPSNARYVRVCHSMSDTNLQIEVGSATAYEPYTAIEIPITFPQTVYGGYVDLVNGELVVTHACIPDIGELEWTVLNSSNPSVYRTIQATGHKAVNGINYMCSAYSAVNSTRSMADMGDKTIKGNTSQTYGDYIYIKDLDYVNDATSFTASVSGVKLVYELETPVVYPITASIIKSLKGINNVWSSANGETEVKFWTH